MEFREQQLMLTDLCDSYGYYRTSSTQDRISLTRNKLKVLLTDESIFGDKFVLTKSRFLDEFLDFFSMLEIALTMQLVPPMLEETLVQEILFYLGEGRIKNYCFNHYKSLLPINLYNRIVEENGPENQYASKDVYPIFIQLLNLDNIKNNLNLRISVFSEINDLKFISKFLLSPDHPTLSIVTKNYIEIYFELLDFYGYLFDLIYATRWYPEIEAAFINYFNFWLDDHYMTHWLGFTKKIYLKLTEKIEEEEIFQTTDFEFFLNANGWDDFEFKMRYLEERILLFGSVMIGSENFVNF